MNEWMLDDSRKVWFDWGDKLWFFLYRCCILVDYIMYCYIFIIILFGDFKDDF